jgi:hypothetical protein
MAAKVIIGTRGSEQHFFEVRSDDGYVIATSRAYPDAEAATDAARWLQRVAASAEIIDEADAPAAASHGQEDRAPDVAAGQAAEAAREQSDRF